MVKDMVTGYPSIDRPWRKYYSKEAFDAPLPECTAYEFLYQKNKEHLGDIALNYYDRKFTYGQLFDNIEHTAKAFSSLGVRPGDIVIICSVNIPETVYAIYGLNRLGAISNMVDPRTNENQLREYISEANAKLVLCIDSAYPVIKKAMHGSTAEQIIVVSPAESLPPIMQTDYQGKNPVPELESKSILWKDFIF